MTVPNFISEAFFYRDLHRGDTMCSPPKHDRQKYPGVDRVKNGKYNITVK